MMEMPEKITDELVFMEKEMLLKNTRALVQKERKITLEILHHLREIQRRKIYLGMGYGSLFDFTVKELGYSTGAVTLLNLALVQTVIKEQQKNGIDVV